MIILKWRIVETIILKWFQRVIHPIKNYPIQFQTTQRESSTWLVLLKKGKNELFIMLMDRNHYLYTKDGRIIYVSKRIYLK